MILQRILGPLILLCFFSCSSRADETVRAWRIAQLSPGVFLLSQPAKKITALFRISAGRAPDDVAAAYWQSPDFKMDAKKLLGSAMGQELDATVDIQTDHFVVGAKQVGRVESRFTAADGYSILISENLWVQRGFNLQFIFASRGTTPPLLSSHDLIFKEFAQDVGLDSNSSASNFLHAFFPAAMAGELGAGARRSAPAPARQGPAVPDCKDRYLPDVPFAKLRDGPPSSSPSPSMQQCGKGIEKAWDDMKTSVSSAINDINRRTAQNQVVCDDFKPQPMKGWWDVGSLMRSTTPMYFNCIQQARQSAAAQHFLEPVIKTGSNLAQGLYEYARAHPREVMSQSFFMGNPMTAPIAMAQYMNQHETLRQVYDFVGKSVTGFRCLTDQEQTKAFCEFATNAGAQLAAAVATDGLSGFSQAKLIAKIVDGGVAAALKVMKASGRKVLERTAERGAARAGATLAARVFPKFDLGAEIKVSLKRGPSLTGKLIEDNPQFIVLKQGDKKIKIFKDGHLAKIELSTPEAQATRGFVRSDAGIASARPEYLANTRLARDEAARDFDTFKPNAKPDSFFSRLRNRHLIASGRDTGLPYTGAERRISTAEVGPGQFRDESAFFKENDGPITTDGTSHKAEFDHLESLGIHRKVKPEIQGYADEIKRAQATGALTTSERIHPGNIVEKDTRFLHMYPRAETLPVWRQLTFDRYKEAHAAVVAASTPEKVAVALDKIADYYHTSINSHMFGKINASIFMNDVNVMLERVGVQAIPHGGLDIYAVNFDYKDFRKVFATYVRDKTH